jgi:hypothetical protein
LKRIKPKKSPPLAGGDEREGEEKGDVAPSPLPCGVKSSTPQGKPSPVKGEGEVADVNLSFSGILSKLPNLEGCVI